MLLFCLTILVITIIGLIVYLSDNGFVESHFKTDLLNIYEDVLFYDFQPGRSEKFPVIGFETCEGWKIAKIDNEELFYLSFKDKKAAEVCYENSVREYGDELSGKVWLYENDIICYKGLSAFVVEMIEEIVLN